MAIFPPTASVFFVLLFVAAGAGLPVSTDVADDDGEVLLPNLKTEPATAV